MSDGNSNLTYPEMKSPASSPHPTVQLQQQGVQLADLQSTKLGKPEPSMDFPFLSESPDSVYSVSEMFHKSTAFICRCGTIA
jgi:hypothetical protein